MLQVIYCYAIGLLSLANAGAVDSPFLVVANWTMGVYFVAIGSLAGWIKARSE